MIGPIDWEEFDNRHRQTDDRQTEKSNPSVPYDTFACFAGLIIVKNSEQNTANSENLLLYPNKYSPL